MGHNFTRTKKLTFMTAGLWFRKLDTMEKFCDWANNRQGFRVDYSTSCLN